MTAKRKRGLGRDLDALLGSAMSESSTAQEPPDGGYKLMPVDLMQSGKYQPRTGMDPEKLDELANSITSQGIVQPIVVRSLGAGRYEIIAGERRWRAAQIAGLQEVPVIIRNVPDEAAIAMSLIENIQRENLNPLEEAVALERLIDEFSMTHVKAAQAVGRSRASVSNLLRLLDLGEVARNLVNERQLDMGHARALLALKGMQQNSAALDVVKRKLSVRETEQLVKQLQKEPSSGKQKTEKIDPNILRLQSELTEKLCAQVNFEHHPSGKGKLVIKYNSLDELDGILEKIK